MRRFRREGEERKFFVVNTRKRAFEPEPKIASEISREAEDALVRQSRVRTPAATGPAIHPVSEGPGPDAAIGRLTERGDVVLREAFNRSEKCEAPLLKAGQAATRGPDPEDAGAIFQERGHVAISELRRVAPIENGEAHAVETHQPLDRA